MLINDEFENIRNNGEAPKCDEELLFLTICLEDDIPYWGSRVRFEDSKGTSYISRCSFISLYLTTTYADKRELNV